MVRLSLAIALMLAGPAQAADNAFVHVNIVPMDRERVLKDQTVIVRDGRILSIGRKLAVPDTTQVIDGRGAWLSPGLADMHVHSDTRDDLAVYLASGVTTIVNMGDARAGFVGRTAPASSRGEIDGPQVFNAFVIDGSPAYGHFTVTTAEEARAAVRLARTNGYRLIKVYNNLSAEAFAAAADEARVIGMPIVGHGVTAVGLRSQVAQGQALIAHAEEFFYTFFSEPGAEQTDEPPADERIASAVAFARLNKIAVGADLVTYGNIMRVIWKPDVVQACLAAARHLAPADRLAWQRSSYIRKTADLSRRFAFLQRLVKAMADADVELLAGTDAPTVPCVAPGQSLHDDLAELEAAGLTRFQILSTATRLPGQFLARTVGAPASGTVVSGARADLILSKGNPLEDLATLREPVGIMIGGRWRDRAAIDLMLNGVAEAYAKAGASH